jgi:hypothetical protein
VRLQRSLLGGIVAVAALGSATAEAAGGRCAADAGRMTAYVSPDSPQELRSLAGYRRANGCPAIDIAVIFAANYAAATRPYLRANNNTPPTREPFNRNIGQVLGDGSVRYLQRRGIKVLLSITNGHQPVGWSQFTSERAARDFARYLKTDVVDRYGLDGIDIDDEYSSGRPTRTSLVMVTTLLRRLMPDKLLTKALYQDLPYFRARWNGRTLAGNLDYAWEMSYGGPPRPRLAPYAPWFDRDRLALGFWAGQPSRTPGRDVLWLRRNGYAGVMIYGFEARTGVDLMGYLVDSWYGRGNWLTGPRRAS